MTYRLSWEQRMSRHRGINIVIEASCWESGRQVWQQCCAHQPDWLVRNVQVEYRTRGQRWTAFDPQAAWPR